MDDEDEAINNIHQHWLFKFMIELLLQEMLFDNWAACWYTPLEKRGFIRFFKIVILSNAGNNDWTISTLVYVTEREEESHL